jgi:hypothetical protein
MSQQVWQVKEPSLLKSISAKHRSRFAALSRVVVRTARLLKNCLCGSKQANKHCEVKQKMNCTNQAIYSKHNRYIYHSYQQVEYIFLRRDTSKPVGNYTLKWLSICACAKFVNAVILREMLHTMIVQTISRVWKCIMHTVTGIMIKYILELIAK